MKHNGLEVFNVSITVIKTKEGALLYKQQNKNQDVSIGSVELDVHSHPNYCGKKVFEPIEELGLSGAERAKNELDFLMGAIEVAVKPKK